MTEVIHQSITNKSRADKFLLVVDIPPVLRDINTPILSKRTQTLIQQDALQFSVWGVVVPTVSVPAQDLRHSGQPYKVTSQSRPTYPPITIDFTIDNKFNNYWVLWKWLDSMNVIRDSGMDNYFGDKNIENKVSILAPKYTDYQTTMVVYAFDEYNNKIAKFSYFNAFITDLGEIRYNYRDETELESNLTFVFNQMDITLLEDGEPAGI